MSRHVLILQQPGPQRGLVPVPSLQAAASTECFDSGKLYEAKDVNDYHKVMDFSRENGGFNTTETQACRYRTKIVTDVVLEVLEDSFGIN